MERQSSLPDIEGPRITDVHIDATIVRDEYIQPEGTTLTLCLLHLKNGFVVTGESACVDPSNFDGRTGMTIAKQKARDKIWQLEGYLLQQKLHDEGFFD